MQHLRRTGKAALARERRDIFHGLQVHGLASITGISCSIHKNQQFYNVIPPCYTVVSSNRELQPPAGKETPFLLSTLPTVYKAKRRAAARLFALLKTVFVCSIGTLSGLIVGADRGVRPYKCSTCFVLL